MCVQRALTGCGVGGVKVKFEFSFDAHDCQSSIGRLDQLTGSFVCTTDNEHLTKHIYTLQLLQLLVDGIDHQ